jgi:hypothetical protein
LRQLPHDGSGNAFVVVAQHVADARHFLPIAISVLAKAASGRAASKPADNISPLKILFGMVLLPLVEDGGNTFTKSFSFRTSRRIEGFVLKRSSLRNVPPDAQRPKRTMNIFAGEV